MESNDWDLTGPVPDKYYFIKLFRRHYRFVGSGLVIVFTLALVCPIFVENSYKSTIHAIFDHTDFAGTGIGVNPQVTYNTVARLFRARFQSQEFLSEVVDSMGGKEALTPESKLPVVAEFRKNLRDFLKSMKSKITGTKDEAESEVDVAEQAKILKNKIDAYPEPESGILTLTAYSHKPEISAELATIAMDLFIKTELEQQIKSLELKLKFLSRDTAPIEAEPVKEVRPKKTDKTDENPSNQLKMMRINEQEAELLDRLRSLNNELGRIKAEQTQTANDYEGQIASLLTNLKPNHPAVIAKRREQETKLSVLQNNEQSIQGEVNEIRRQLWSLRASKINPRSDDGEILDDPIGAYRGAFFVALSDRVKDLDLEKKNLIRQLANPTSRTRIKILFPATIETNAFKSQKRDVALAIFGLGSFFLIGFSVLRELRCPLARDDWRVERSTKQPILSQISEKSLSLYRRISPEIADQLREKLASHEWDDQAARTLLSYRRWELAIEQHCKGNVILLLSAGPMDATGRVIHSFVNIYATDTGKRCLLFDCDHKDPVFKKAQNKDRDFVDVLSGEVNWQEVIIPCSIENLGIGYDFIPPSLGIKGTKTRVFNKERMDELVQNLRSNYELIFIRGMPEYHFTENISILNAATDCMICVDATQTTFADLERTITHMGSEKLRGLVLIGS